MWNSFDVSGYNGLNFNSVEHALLDLSASETTYGLATSHQSFSNYSLPSIEAINTGIFTVGETGEVSFNYLFDGGGYEGELAIFSLLGMEQYGIGSTIFIQEAALRASQNSPDWGYVVISDSTEGAKFFGSIEYEDDLNSGHYLGTKTFNLHPGSQFGIMLVPNGTVKDALIAPDINGEGRPLFSIPKANVDEAIQFAQVTQLNADGQQQVNGNTFSFEDIKINQNSDRDYNDLVFQLGGVTGEVPSLNQVINPKRDWRNSKLGQEIIQSMVDPLDYAGNTIDLGRKVNLSSLGKVYQGWVGNIDTDDYYSFSLGTSNHFSLLMDGTSADADIQLLDTHGNILHLSNGTIAKSIDTTLDAGAYRLRVIPGENVGTMYNLTLSSTPLIDGITTTGSDSSTYFETNASTSLIRVNDFRSGNPSLGSNARFAGINGSGWYTVVLDTGINLSHPFFGSDSNGDGISDRIVYSFDFADNDTDATDVSGHGTNVTSIIASQDGTYTGVAPAANIISLKVFSNSGNGSFGATEQALQWVISNAATYKIASVNLSIGDGNNWNTAAPRYGIGDELQRLADLGIIVVAASGNSFAGFSGAQGVQYPAADLNSLSIGAVWDANNSGPFSWASGAIDFTTNSNRIVSFSQRSEALTTALAPGAQITGAGLSSNSTSSDFITTRSGTSQAAPHVAGMAILAQQLAEQTLGRRLTPGEFRNLLRSTGVTINDGDDENDNVTNTGLNFPRVDMLSLGQAILNS